MRPRKLKCRSTCVAEREGERERELEREREGERELEREREGERERAREGEKERVICKRQPQGRGPSTKSSF